MRVSALTVFVLALAIRRVSAQSCANVGVERWTVKTSAPLSTSVRRIGLAAFGKLPTPKDIHIPHDKMLDTRYPSAIRPGLHEGNLVSVTGWVQKIKTSGDDCDYHIEIATVQDGSSGLVILEVPEPGASHVDDPTLRARLEEVRRVLVKQLKLKGEPSRGGNEIGGRAYMTFSGALFFDGPHAPGCKRGTGKASVTCWEIHPVTSVKFAARPR